MAGTLYIKGAIKLIVGLLKKGVSKPDIKLAIFSRNPKIKEKTWNTWYETAQKRLANDNFNQDISDIYNLHLNRYEQMYYRSKRKLEAFGDIYDEDHWKQFITYTKTALMALRKKEEMMGLHPKQRKDKNINILVNQGNMVVVAEQSTIGFSAKASASIGDLTLEERIELRELFRAARKEEIEGVWPTRKVKRGEDLQDIIITEAEIVEDDDDLPENVIEKMKVEREPLAYEPDQSLDVLGDIQKSLEKRSKQQLLDLLNKNKTS